MFEPFFAEVPFEPIGFYQLINDNLKKIALHL